ncbi:MAG TPA: undecaprenyl-diphosphate phosphatase [Candidatus Polarisedimenticolaceae bacterium]
MTLWLALLLGLVEGLTEFLPISSTGHLILVSEAFGLTGQRAEVFDLFIQLGAVLAVVVEYRRRLFDATRPGNRGFLVRVGVAFVPAAVLGLVAHDFISERLFSARTVAAALIAGAALILVVEALPRRERTATAEAAGFRQALGIGLAQCLALWPGFSRSAATILGGLVCGLNRPAATEFSFFLAIPTLGSATLYSLLKRYRALEPGDALYLAVAFAASFFVAWWSIRWLLRYVSSHTLRPFAWYRIALGLLVLWATR